MKTYYDRRTPEYDDWWLGEGLYAERDRPGWEERRLRDGSRWTVLKRVFTGPELADELAGEVAFEGDWFVVVRA